MSFILVQTTLSTLPGLRLIVTLIAILLAVPASAAAASEGESVDSSVVGDTSGTDLAPGLSGTEHDVISGDLLQSLPVRTIEDVQALNSSIVEYRPRYTPLNGPQIHVRGGEIYDNRVYINGVAFSDPISGAYTGAVSRVAVQSIGLTPSAYGADQGGNGAITQVVTRSGGDDYSGGVEVVSDNVGGSRFDQNWYSAWLGGPVPGLKKGRFFGAIERRWLGDRNPSCVTEEVLPGSSGRLPNNSQSGWSYHGRFDWQLTSSARLTLTGDGSVDNWQQYLHYYNNPDYPDQIRHTLRYEDKSLGFSGVFAHDLTSTAGYTLRASHVTVERFSGDGEVFDDIDAYQREQYNPDWDEYYLYRQGDSLFASAFSWFEPGDLDTFVTFYDSYYEMVERQKTSELTLSGEFCKQFPGVGQLATGFDFQRRTIRRYVRPVASAPSVAWRVNRYGYDTDGNESDDEGYLNEAKHPIEAAAYVNTRLTSDRIDFSFGLRLEHFNTNCLKPSNWMYLGMEDGLLDRDEMSPSESHIRLSPRASLVVAPNDRVQVRLHYGHYYQAPPASMLYIGWDYFIMRTLAGSFSDPINPDLEPLKTEALELGGDLQVVQDVAFSARVSFHRMRNAPHYVFVSPQTGYRTYVLQANYDKRDIRGIELGMKAKPSDALHVRLEYTWSRSRSNANEVVFVNWSVGPTIPPTELVNSTVDQRHCIVGSSELRLRKGEGPRIGNTFPFENTVFGLVTKIASGLPYTPTAPQYYEVSESRDYPISPTGPIRSERGPAVFSIDAKFEKQVTVGGAVLTPFVWVENLLDRKNVVSVYEGSGYPDRTGFLESEVGRETVDALGPQFVADYQRLENNPQNYAPPRQVWFGIRASF